MTPQSPIISYFCFVENKAVQIKTAVSELEQWFEPFRKNIIGIDQTFSGPDGEKVISYADWTASGRLYRPIEERMQNEVAPFVANTHTETSFTGSTMTQAYHHAMHLIKRHVNASENDIIISSNSGMTGVVNKFQRILGLKIHERYRDRIHIPDEERPVVFLTHMEHHSNQTTWLETICTVEIMDANEEGLVELSSLEKLLDRYKNRKVKIAAITSCSNVTGIKTPYHEMAAIMHRHGGLCFVDFACSAPYIDINMHPKNEEQALDAIFFSPHKFLGGPGSSGILIFNKSLYTNRVPDNPGGGTVDWTNPWGEHKYIDNIEAREDGGTPSFLQTIRVAMCIRLKEAMNTEKILAREKELIDIIWPGLEAIPNLHILAGNIRERLGVISFYIDQAHYNLIVQLLNDKYGIQVRGGCSCAGTYGHYLLHVDKDHSKSITEKINLGDMSDKPGWVRLSVHPTTTNEEARLFVKAITDVAENHEIYAADYKYNSKTNEFEHKSTPSDESRLVDQWLNRPL
ncbi:MAG: aminotransferase class V-fold PLP-dependent enzyme [Flavobacteriales bacterium]|nr:aminotransferase class V-fold PLP-dependent enzyme [Flavobacteriales bacterium]